MLEDDELHRDPLAKVVRLERHHPRRDAAAAAARIPRRVEAARAQHAQQLSHTLSGQQSARPASARRASIARHAAKNVHCSR